MSENVLSDQMALMTGYDIRRAGPRVRSSVFMSVKFLFLNEAMCLCVECCADSQYVDSAADSAVYVKDLTDVGLDIRTVTQCAGGVKDLDSDFV